MNIMLLVGMVTVFGSIFFSLPHGAQLSSYWDPLGAYLIIGATIGCGMMMCIKPKDFLNILSILSGVMYMKRKRLTHVQAVQICVKIATEAQRSGKASVLEMGKGVGDGYLERALTLMGSGLEIDFVRRVLEADIDEEKKRHQVPITIVRNMATLSPMFGILGNVMGVVLLMGNISDIDAVAGGMKMALISTTYGLIFSSTIFLPIANKLKFLNDEDAVSKEILKEGILAIMGNEIPLKVEKRLSSYLSNSNKKVLEKKK